MASRLFFIFYSENLKLNKKITIGIFELCFDFFFFFFFSVDCKTFQLWISPASRFRIVRNEMNDRYYQKICTSYQVNDMSYQIL